jgi:two-component system phosphate regulon response regulator PhoB
MTDQALDVLLVEDELGIAELLRFTLMNAGHRVCLVASIADAQKYIKQSLPHIVILDWMLPDGAGIDLVSAWRKEARTSALPVIMLTAKGLEEDKVAGLNAGADDYITKPFSPKELVARIQALLRRKLPEVGNERLTLGVVELLVDTQELRIDGKAVAIDHAEFKLLRFLIAHAGRAFSRAQLLDKVWGDHTFIEERTVDVHVMRLRKVLGSTAHYLQTVRSVGYKIAVPD